MIVGHFATALVPHSRLGRAHLWLLLLASNVADFLWLLLVPLGLEQTRPHSFMDVTFQGLQVEMPYSHDLIPTLVLALLFALVVLAVYRNKTLAIWCAVLIVVHLLCDLVAGFPHYILGPQTAKIGLGLYHTSPHLAIVLEAIMGGALVFWFQRKEAEHGRAISRGQAIALYAIFVGGALLWLPTATLSLNDLLRMAGIIG